MKYRILEKDGRFYPQRKWLCFWLYFDEYSHPNHFTIARWSLREAKYFIDNYIAHLNNKTKSKVKTIHEYKS